MAPKYAGRDTAVVSDGGGAERITLDGSGLGQGANVPCRKVFITQPYANTLVARVNIGVTASATLGIDIPHGGSTVATAPLSVGPLELNISNTNLLYFFGDTTTGKVDILYLN